MNGNLKDFFKDPKNILVLDGGFSTQLTHHISERVDGNPLWCSGFLHTDPEAVKKTHLDYLRAGADIIITNTYQASIEGFKTHLKLNEEESIKLIEKAVLLAKDARDIYLNENKDSTRKPLIAGSVGPYGACLHNGSEYNGSYINQVSLKEMEEWHKPRIEALVNAGVDLLAIEAMPASSEAEMLLNYIKKAHPNTKAWLSFSCKDAEHTNFGENFQEVSKKCYELNPEQLVAVGVNCTNPKYIEKLFEGFNDDKADKIPLVIYPNSGENYDLKKGWVDADKCIPLESYVEKWLNLGIKIIGSCCRTYAENTKLIQSEVDKWRNSQ